MPSPRLRFGLILTLRTPTSLLKNLTTLPMSPTLKSMLWERVRVVRREVDGGIRLVKMGSRCCAQRLDAFRLTISTETALSPTLREESQEEKERSPRSQLHRPLLHRLKVSGLQRLLSPT